MPFPHWVARLNKRYTNQCIEPVMRRFSSYVVIRHIGRSSGTAYATPVNAFALDGAFIISLTYGPSADWVRNVLASPGSIEINGRIVAITDAEIVGRTVALPAFPRLIRVALRLLGIHHFLKVSVDQDTFVTVT